MGTTHSLPRVLEECCADLGSAHPTTTRSGRLIPTRRGSPSKLSRNERLQTVDDAAMCSTGGTAPTTACVCVGVEDDPIPMRSYSPTQRARARSPRLKRQHPAAVFDGHTVYEAAPSSAAWRGVVPSSRAPDPQGRPTGLQPAMPITFAGRSPLRYRASRPAQPLPPFDAAAANQSAGSIARSAELAAVEEELRKAQLVLEAQRRAASHMSTILT